VRIAFLGPAGTFTEEALRGSAPPGAEAVPYPTVHETVMAVEAGEADRAVVPIENSLEGSVAATLDTLAAEADRVRVVAEAVVPIRHALLARPGVTLADVRRVLSHPQALAQCARFLREQIPLAEAAPAASTAEAVRAVAAERGEPWAAIGSLLAAELYGCVVLAEGIEDHSDNVTRFAWIARAGAAPSGAGAGPRKTSLVFWGFNDESPGALVAVLREFADRGINLTKIESRPRRVRLGHYMFFADLEGGQEDPPLRDALRALRGRVEELRVLGSYPAP
jgi:prephenate dehydratase